MTLVFTIVFLGTAIFAILLSLYEKEEKKLIEKYLSFIQSGFHYHIDQNCTSKEICSKFFDKLTYVHEDAHIQKSGIYKLVNDTKVAILAWTNAIVFNKDNKIIKGNYTFTVNEPLLITLISQNKFSSTNLNALLNYIKEEEQKLVKKKLDNLQVVTESSKTSIKHTTKVMPKLQRVIKEKYPEFLI